MKIVLLAILLLFVPVVASLEIKIDVADQFSPGEMMRFSYTILSEKDMTISYTPYIICKTIPIGFLETRSADIKAGANIVGEKQETVVTEDYPPEDCQAIVRIELPIKMVEIKTFHINTKPSLQYEIYADSQEGAKFLRKIYYLNDILHLNTQDEAVQAFIQYPSKKTVPADGALLNEIGTYTLSYGFDKSGFKPVNQKVQITVIQGAAKPNVISLSHPVQQPEQTNPQNLAGKLATSGTSSQPGSGLVLGILLGIIGLSTIGFLIFYRRR